MACQSSLYKAWKVMEEEHCAKLMHKNHNYDVLRA